MTKYPSLTLDYDDKYVSLTEAKEIYVYLSISSSANIDITDEVTIYSLDGDVYYNENSLTFFKVGINKVCFSYTYDDEDLYEEIEFVVYDSFYKDNYKYHFIPEIDRINLQNNVPLEVLFDTLFEFIDIIDAYTEDIDKIKNPFKTKEKFLKSLFGEKGFNFIDFENENGELDELSSKIYRNLLNNLDDILEVRGTETAYELFFGVLGYDIEIFNYWFNDNEELIEMSITDPDNSTFDVYSVNGELLSDENTTRIDPRIYVASGNDKTYYSKSNFIRVQYTKNVNFPDDFTQSKSLIKKYLDWLKPRHLKYLTEIYSMDEINDEEVEMILEDELSFTSFEDLTDDDDITSGFDCNFTSTYGSIEISGGISSFFIDTFISSGEQVEISGGYDASSNYFVFESEEGIIEISGVVNETNFYSDGELLSVSGDSDYVLSITPTFVTSSPTIAWDDYLTEINKDNGEVGVVKGWNQPAEFFSLDFRSEDTEKTFNEKFFLTEGIELSDTIRSYTRYDADDVDFEKLVLDDFVFLIEAVADSDTLFQQLTEDNISSLKSKYDSLSLTEEQSSDETETEYETRIKYLAVSSLYDDFFISEEIIDVLLN